ncbi:MAG: Eco57I restriction-modification methylase domain-containing protein [Bacteroidetes bacterium]|nr:Eco57I restriction-modification methylase domain-containing protein [Bacteroidota bacterium]
MKSHQPDILDCLANLSSDEVFTPPWLAQAMLDHLPDQVWKDPSLKWLDPCTKSGIFLREAARRLMIGLESKIPDFSERRDHIYRNMLYGIAITELTSLISRRTVYECKDASLDAHSIVTFDDHEGNIRFPEVDLKVVSGKSFEPIDRRASERVAVGRESHMYPFLYMDLSKIFGEENMHFDVIMGNPPYQMQDGGGSGKSAVPIYNKFVEKAKECEPDFLTFVIPARWYSGGRGLDGFRQRMLSDEKISILVDYPNAEDVFPNVDIAGGICIFLRDKFHHEQVCLIIPNGEMDQAKCRRLNEYDVFVRDSQDIKVINKVETRVQELEWTYMSEIVHGSNFYGIRPHELPSTVSDTSQSDDSVLLVTKDGDKYIPRSDLDKNSETLHLWKVIISKTNPHGGRADKSGLRPVISKPRVISPNSACTETYLVIDCFSSDAPAGRLLDYVKTKFFRFLLSLRTPTHNISQKCFEFVPALPLDRNWNDEILYEFFDLTDEDIAHIESKIKPIN